MAGPPPFGTGLVTLDGWQDPPQNRWAFQHVRELVPTARIRRGSEVRELPSAPADLGSVSFSWNGRECSVDQMIDDTYTDGFLVLHRGRVVYERYLNGMLADTPHLLMSVSKSVVSAVAGALSSRGLLDVTAPVTAVVPQLAGTSFEGAIVQHLLDMRAGTRFNEEYEDLQADVRTYERIYLWRPDDGRPRPADALAYFATLVNDGPHGGPFRYRSILTDVLGWVLECAGGARLHELISSLVWQPMGAEHDAEITVDGHGNAMADAGVSATLRDLARFGALHLSDTSDWVADTVRGAPDGASAFVSGPEERDWPPGAHYRNCWWVRDPSVPVFIASGIYGQNIYVLPADELVVAKFSTWPTPLSEPFAGQTYAAVEALAALLRRQPSETTVG